MVPVHSPDTSRGRNSDLSSGEPCAVKTSTALCVSNGQSANAMFAEFQISDTAVATSHGKSWPPNSGAEGTAFQPPATKRA
jgi:hypothetical protein